MFLGVLVWVFRLLSTQNFASFPEPNTVPQSIISVKFSSVAPKFCKSSFPEHDRRIWCMVGVLTSTLLRVLVWVLLILLSSILTLCLKAFQSIPLLKLVCKVTPMFLRALKVWVFKLLNSILNSEQKQASSPEPNVAFHRVLVWVCVSPGVFIQQQKHSP